MNFNQTDIGLLLFYIASGIVGMMILLLYISSRGNSITSRRVSHRPA